jgi:hypothetical protein
MAKRTKADEANGKSKPSKTHTKFPKLSIERALRIPKAILEQNAGKACSDRDSATYVGVKYNHGPYSYEIGNAIKYGLLERPTPGQIALTETAKKILRPQRPEQIVEGFREAALKPAEFSKVYSHYRGENLPDQEFLDNALTDTFSISKEKVSEFKEVFFENLKKAQLLVEREDGKTRVLDVSQETSLASDSSLNIKKLDQKVKTDEGGTCFVVMPFADPIGGYFKKIYEPAIVKAGLKPIRADNEIFGTGKVMDQVWSGINSAKVLVAELTERNPNVFYELGIAHALHKPVVLVSSNDNDVPFDLRHIRVIYYEKEDPFWGAKLLDKVAENIVSALNNPEEAIFQTEVTSAKGK